MPPTKRPTLTAIASDLGVSAKTVSNAFNHPDQLSADLRSRILGRADELGYSGPDPLARAFRRGATGVIGVVYGNPLTHAFIDQAFVRFLEGLSFVLEAEERSLLLLPASASIADVAMDGAIVYSIAADDVALRDLAQRRIPFVTVDQPQIDGVPWIGIDDRAGGRIVGQHLRDLGHREIGILSFALTSDAMPMSFDLEDRPAGSLSVTSDRLAGLADVLPASVPVVQVMGSSQETSVIGARELLAQHPEITTIVCFGDRMAVGAITVAREMGRIVPGDLSVTGFDDVLSEAEGLTSVRQPHAEKGRLAGEALVRLLGGDAKEARQVLDVELVVRSSTGRVKE